MPMQGEMGPPPRPLSSSSVRANTSSPPPFSSPSPEEVRIFRNLQVREVHSLDAAQRQGHTEADDQEMFFFDESMASRGDNSPIQITEDSEPALFVSPANYVPRSRTIPSPTPEAGKVAELEQRSRSIHRSSSAAPTILSTSEPSKISTSRSVKAISSPTARFSCCCCRASFIEQANLAYHFATEHRGKHNHPTQFIKSCSLCGESFQSRKDLDIHLLACGVVPPRRRDKKQAADDANAHHYSALSLSPPGHDAVASGRDSQLSLASITSSPSELELSDFNSADDESTTIQKLFQDARKYALHNVGKAADVEGEPVSPTKRRKSAISSRFAKNFTKNITKAIETGRIKIEGLSESLDAAVAPADVPEPSPSARTKGFPQPSSKGKSKAPQDQSPFVDMLACPFAKGDPQKYLTCLLIHRKDMPGLREHLGRVHFGGSTPDGAIRSKDWPSLFLFCFPNWNQYIPDGGFDYSQTIEMLQALSLGEPINKFLRDLEKHLAFRRTKELKELETIYNERSWRKFQEFLGQAYRSDQGQPPPPQRLPPPPASFQQHSYGQGEARTITLSVSRDIEFALNRQIDFPFPLGDFSANDFRRWLDMIFNPPISFMENHLILPEYNVKIRSLQDLEAFLNLELPSRQSSGRRGREDTVTVFIRENWTELIAGTPGHHY
ncbi:hypothetical protein TWF696_002960 [Orbilia brochopaga]|uniref:C2H2-type domain-containing protein n=1 Tax=Orbilia brochopaga TaxID=3140254 RepID=A0AAV9TYF4_9PEZI